MALLQSQGPIAREIDVSTPRLSSVTVMLFVCVLLFLFIGLSPFPSNPQVTKDELIEKTIGAASGNLTNQIVWSLFVFVACLILYSNPLRTRKLLARSVPLLIFLALCVVSISWSPEPGITARRVIRLLFEVTVVAGITVGLTSSRIFHRVAILVTGLAMLVNSICRVLPPD